MGRATIDGLVALALGVSVCLFWAWQAFTAPRGGKSVYLSLLFASLGWVVVALLVSGGIDRNLFWLVRAVTLLMVLFLAASILRSVEREDFKRRRL